MLSEGVDVGEAWYQNVLHFLLAAISACPLLAYMQRSHSKECLYAHVCVCICVWTCVRLPEEARRWIPCSWMGCELLVVGAGNQTHSLSKSSKCS